MNRCCLFGVDLLKSNVERWRDVMKYDPKRDAPESEKIRNEVVWHCDLIINSFDFLIVSIISYLYEHDDGEDYPFDAFVKRFFPEQYEILQESEQGVEQK